MGSKAVYLDQTTYDLLIKNKEHPTEEVSHIIHRMVCKTKKETGTLDDLFRAALRLPHLSQEAIDSLIEDQKNDVPPEDMWEK